MIVSLLFLGMTAFFGMLGYRKRVEREPGGAASTVLAAIPDMSAVRQLTDQCRLLCEHIEKLDATLSEHTYYLRNKIEVDTRLAHLVRELIDERIRSDRQRAQREGGVPPTPPV